MDKCVDFVVLCSTVLKTKVKNSAMKYYATFYMENMNPDKDKCLYWQVKCINSTATCTWAGEKACECARVKIKNIPAGSTSECQVRVLKWPIREDPGFGGRGNFIFQCLHVYLIMHCFYNLEVHFLKRDLKNSYNVLQNSSISYSKRQSQLAAFNSVSETNVPVPRFSSSGVAKQYTLPASCGARQGRQTRNATEHGENSLSHPPKLGSPPIACAKRVTKRKKAQ